MASRKPSFAAPSRHRPRGAAAAASDRSDALELAVAETRAWVDRAVVGLGLCPFAKAATAGGRTRFIGTAAADAETLLAAFCAEARHLIGVETAAVETTIIVHPFVLQDFESYNDFLDVVDAALEALGLEGVLQVASFHPAYRFADTDDEDLGNATNRSPHPTLQLLREASVTRAIDAFPESASIYERNLETLQALGAKAWAALRAACREDAEAVLAADRSADSERG